MQHHYINFHFIVYNINNLYFYAIYFGNMYNDDNNNISIKLLHFFNVMYFLAFWWYSIYDNFNNPTNTTTNNNYIYATSLH